MKNIFSMLILLGLWYPAVSMAMEPKFEIDENAVIGIAEELDGKIESGELKDEFNRYVDILENNPAFKAQKEELQKGYGLISWKNASRAGFIAAMIATGWLGGPYVSIAAEKLFPIVYTTLIGPIPTNYVGYYLWYLPAMKHVGNIAFNYSSYILGAGAAIILVGYESCKLACSFAFQGVSGCVSGLKSLCSCFGGKTEEVGMKAKEGRELISEEIRIDDTTWELITFSGK